MEPLSALTRAAFAGPTPLRFPRLDLCYGQIQQFRAASGRCRASFVTACPALVDALHDGCA